MGDLGKLLVAAGALLLIVGLVFVFFGKNLPLGRLPGDIVFRGKNSTLYFPLVSSILISVVVSAVLYLIGRFHR